MKDNQSMLVRKPDPNTEFPTPERSRILELWNDPSDEAVSIARATVAPGVTTQLHRLVGVAERYIILAGLGSVQIGAANPETLGPGDVLVIPADAPQQITNIGESDLVFYCICSPRFSPECYESLE